MNNGVIDVNEIFVHLKDQWRVYSSDNTQFGRVIKKNNFSIMHYVNVINNKVKVYEFIIPERGQLQDYLMDEDLFLMDDNTLMDVKKQYMYIEGEENIVIDAMEDVEFIIAQVLSKKLGELIFDEKWTSLENLNNIIKRLNVQGSFIKTPQFISYCEALEAWTLFKYSEEFSSTKQSS
ncbi:MAG: hypothetical protein Q8936_15015 [Bacillota bacterium]|nr:hypothetical protein [Bacillota bacterium]